MPESTSADDDPQDRRARVDELTSRVAAPSVVTGKVVADPDPDDEPGEPDDEPQSSPDLVFTTKPKDRTDSDVGQALSFTIDGEWFEATKPTDDAFVFLTTAAARSTPMGERMASIITFVDNALSDESAIRVRDRLLDRDDDFGFEDLLELLQTVVKHWTRDKKPGPARHRARARRRR